MQTGSRSDESAGAVTVRWRGRRLGSSETCRLRRRADGWQLNGQVDLPLGGVATRLTYTIDTNAGWCTRAVEVTADHGPLADDPLRLTAGGGEWTVGGRVRPDLRGCVDVDLGFSPATNTLPIRRLDPPPGTVVPVAAAWVTLPAFAVERLDQSYEHLGDGQWRYRSGEFTADLTVDEHGLVSRYGKDLWSRDTGG